MHYNWKTCFITLVLLAGCLSILACTSDGKLLPDPYAAEQTPGNQTPIDPPAGFNDDDSDDDTTPGGDEPTMPEMLQALVDEYVIFSGDPGMAMGVWLPDQPMQTFTAGQANLQTDLALNAENRFRVGSTTKMFVAAIILQLLEEGLLTLDDPITDYLPERYAMWEGITVGNLLRMESGISEFIMDTNFWLFSLLTRRLPKDPEFVLSFVMGKPLEFEPGAQCSYCGTNYLLLGMIIEAVTGNDAADEFDRRIIEPLGLKKTHLDMKLEEMDDLARGYADIMLAGAVFGLSGDLMAITVLIPPELMLSETMFDGSYLLNPTAFWTSGALVSYPEDLLRFMKSFMQGELFGAEMLELVKDFKTCDEYGETVDYSVGIMVRHTPYGLAYGHGGKYFGYSTDTYYLPDADLTFSFLHNYVPDQNEGLMDELWRTAMGDLPRSREACTPPDGFFPATDDGYLHFRVKGKLNDPADEEPLPAIAYSLLSAGETTIPYYSLDSKVTLFAGESGRSLYVETIGPTTEPDYNWRVAALNLDEANLASTQDGIMTITADGAYSPLFLTLQNVRLDAETGEPDKRCVVGVPDWERPSQLFLCEPDLLVLEAGQIARLFGRVAVQFDAERVTAYLAQHQQPQCTCLAETGQWEPCE